MSKDRIDVSDNTAISMPVRNMLAIIGAVAVGVWAYFGVLERITMLETKSVLTEKDINQHVERLETEVVKNTADNSLVKFNLNIKDTKKVLNQIIKEYSTKVVQKMKKPTIKNKLINNKEYVKKYLANQKVKEFYASVSYLQHKL